MSEIRIGVAGLKGRGQHWLRLLQQFPEYRVTALCDLYEAPLTAAAELLHDADIPRFRDYDEFLGRADMDAVALVVRSEHQGAMAAQALEAGKHVHAEVPVAHSIEDCWRLVLAQERSGKVYQLAEQLRYAGYIEQWRRLVQDGKLGQITYAEGQYLHYYVGSMFYDPETGQACGPDSLAEHPRALPSWLNRMPPIHYVVHDLSPLLKVLDDRVVEVVGMSTDGPSRHHPEIAAADLQTALFKTAKGAVMRFVCSFAQPHPHGDMHWLQVIGTGGSLEWRRAKDDTSRCWFSDAATSDKQACDWDFTREDEPEAAKNSGHWNLDWYVHASFRDAVLHGKRPDADVYQAAEIAAPSILAAESMTSKRVLPVPDFRPGANRAVGVAP